jgi:hypothetical protein
MLFRGLLKDEDAIAEYHPIAQRYHETQLRMQALLRDFASRAAQPEDYLFVEYSKVPICAELHLDLLTEKSAEQTFSDMRRNVERFEAWVESFEQEVSALPQREPAEAKLEATVA